jgi:hypothetical protein
VDIASQADPFHLLMASAEIKEVLERIGATVTKFKEV